MTAPSYLKPVRCARVPEMRLFDRLPRAIRDALNDAPVNLSVRALKKGLDANGEARVLAELRRLEGAA